MCLPDHAQDRVSSSIPIEQLSSSRFQNTAAELESHTETIRIKKIFFYLSQKYWENDSKTLNRFPLQDLIRQVLQFYPNHAHLKFTVFELVASLNHSDAYLIPATTLVDCLMNFYHFDSVLFCSLLRVVFLFLSITPLLLVSSMSN